MSYFQQKKKKWSIRNKSCMNISVITVNWELIGSIVCEKKKDFDLCIALHEFPVCVCVSVCVCLCLCVCVHLYVFVGAYLYVIVSCIDVVWHRQYGEAQCWQVCWDSSSHQQGETHCNGHCQRYTAMVVVRVSVPHCQVTEIDTLQWSLVCCFVFTVPRLSKNPSFPSWSEPTSTIFASCLMMFSTSFRTRLPTGNIILDRLENRLEAGFSTEAVEKPIFSKLVRTVSNHLSIMQDDVFEWFPTRLATGNII